MSEVTLEKIDIIRERSGVTYTKAKEALEACDGNVVDALVYIENEEECDESSNYTTKEEFVDWIKSLVSKGNVNRIKVRKGEKVIVDIPVNAGVAATLAALVWPPLLGIGVAAAIFTKVTIEITKDDGTVEVVNKIIKNTAKDIKEKMQDTTSNIKDKFNKEDEEDESGFYQYTVNFEDDDNKNDSEENK
ncbi:DUF4342 domain-containing protein [Clostridium oceanicum]|uniref:DUF4342 domain-containing protein n=1 Tax=Clostridium oceanicum TaxID=1543 RepID=A0ABP3V4A2_9CLOT